MPQASDELRDKMHRYFGDRIDNAGPERFLRGRGWTEVRPGNSVWIKPKDHEISEQEWDCLQFLCDEWDHAYEGE